MQKLCLHNTHVLSDNHCHTYNSKTADTPR